VALPVFKTGEVEYLGLASSILVRLRHGSRRTTAGHADGMTGRKDKLAEYRRKRDFAATTEPRGSKKHSGTAPHFVIQHHLARADHYDFRLEIDGVLVSWAVPKGPSMNPDEHRLAVRTEDHPLDYETFEGRIGEGGYGGGTVQVWDRGTFENTSRDKQRQPIDAGAALERGHVSFWLEGEKLRGGFSLIRTRNYQDRESWLLTKKADETADARRRPTSTQNASVLTGRTMDEIAAADE
jgi:DNA ligase D-like protein (predicted 3'-phosphoesterase)